MKLKEHIFLIGMAGSGKTSLGQRLANNAGVGFFDTDQRINEAMGMTVNEIYDSIGQIFFRNAETAALIEMTYMPPSIISTGEGTVLNNDNIAIMRNHGIILFIDRPLDQILSDIKMDRRPTLRGGSHDDVIEQYTERIGFYRSAADYRFDNSHGFVQGVAGITALIEEIHT